MWQMSVIRRKFIRNVITFLHKFKMDGLELNWNQVSPNQQAFYCDLFIGLLLYSMTNVPEKRRVALVSKYGPTQSQQAGIHNFVPRDAFGV
jgi:hypothetical protein